MRKFIFTILLLLAGYVGYMYFFGQGDDREKAETIINETKDLGKAVGDFLSTQKEKYDEGEFDALIDKVGSMLNKLKSGSKETHEEVQDDLENLQKELKQIDPEKLSDDKRKALEKLLKEVDAELQ